MIKRAVLTYKLSDLQGLISFWLAFGVNLALGEPLVELCAATMSRFCQNLTEENSTWFNTQSRLLYHNSMRRLKYSQNTSQAQFNTQYLDDSTRWETVGIFFTAVARATFDVKFYPTLYKDAAELLGLREFAADISDSCLDLCLKLDCMNDLQLVLQYENFIIHSYVDGDQSECVPKVCSIILCLTIVKATPHGEGLGM